MSEPILKISNLSKNYGRIKAVDQLSLEVNKGEVFGILGPNGSGKTTSLGIILSIIQQKSGTFSWFGNIPSKKDRIRIGAIVETPIFYPYLTATQNLKIYADIRNVPYTEIDKVLKTVDLFKRKNSKFNTYSLGMKQRLAIAGTLLGNPEVLILDEPTNGLDPQGIAEIRNLIIDIAQQGITIILASHLLDEVQKICTHVAVLETGKSIFSGKIEDVLNESMSLEISAQDNVSLAGILAELDIVKNFKKEGNIFVANINEGISADIVNKAIFEKGLVLNHLSLKKKSLEKHFLELLDHDKTA